MKSLTGAVLSSMGELISQCTVSVAASTGNHEEDAEKASLHAPNKIRKILADLKLSKVFFMFCYGGLINAPINHYMYGWITNATNKRMMSARIKKTVQLLASLSMVAPLQVLFLVSTLTLLNSKVNNDIPAMLRAIKQGLKSKYLKILTSSWVSTSVLVSIAQNFIEPEKWSIFFSFAYAFLGTAQNIFLKLKDEPSIKKDN